MLLISETHIRMHSNTYILFVFESHPNFINKFILKMLLRKNSKNIFPEKNIVYFNATTSGKISEMKVGRKVVIFLTNIHHTPKFAGV